MTKKELLQKFLEGLDYKNINLECINLECSYLSNSTNNDNANYFDETNTNETYLILTEEEADKKAKEEILNSLWIFNPDFLVDYINYDYNSTEEKKALILGLLTIQNKLCENANKIIEILVKDNLEDLINDAIESDGRGAFLSTYNGEEEDIIDPDTKEIYYIYRID